MRHTVLVASSKVKATFIEPMLLLRCAELPDEELWLKEIKFDGYRALGIKAGGKVELRSRNANDFSGRYPAIAKALVKMPDETVIDGEVVAIDESGHPSFNLLQNYGSSKAPLLYYAFDVLAGTSWTKRWASVARSSKSISSPYSGIPFDIHQRSTAA